MEFRTKYGLYSERDRHFTNGGSQFKDEYAYKTDKETGYDYLEKVGQTNIYDYIQSFADSVDINILMQRFEDGDTEAFNKVNGIYIDTTQFPKTYAEMFAQVKECDRIFAQLPPDVREKFDNQSGVFWNEYGTENFYEKLGVAKVDTSDVIKEVKPDAE